MGTRIAASTHLTHYGWTDSPFWKQTVLPVLVVVLVLRLVTVLTLGRSQHGYRARLLSRARQSQIRTLLAGDASRRQFELRALRTAYPPRRIAAAVELVLPVLVGAGLTVLLWIGMHRQFQGDDALDQEAVRTSPPWLAARGLLALFGGEGGLGAALTGLVLTALWQLLWARTRFLVLCTRMPSGTWEHSRLRRYLVPVLAAQFLLMPLVLPNGALLALMVWQLCLLYATRRLNLLPTALAAPPLTGVTASADAPAGAVRDTVDTLGAAASARLRSIRETREAQRTRRAREAAARAAAAQNEAAVAARDAETARAVLAESEALRAARDAGLADAAARFATGPTVAGGPAGPAAATAVDGTVRDPDAVATVRGPDGPPRPDRLPTVDVKPLPSGAPTAIGGYRLIGLIGSGGFGTVYLARRQGSATQVALKTLHADTEHDEELHRRFANEAKVLARAPAAHTARVLDTGVADGTPFIAMELLDGCSLQALLRERGPLADPAALRALAVALAVSLDALHRGGLVHRDLKPSNIMMTSDGPKLLDFGISLMVDHTRLTRTGGMVGTPVFMAPEQLAEGPVGPAADVWAWACCLICAAHGDSPFATANPYAVYHRIVNEDPDPAAVAAVRALDPELADTVGRALAKDLADRPADGAALLALLTADGTPAQRQIDRGWEALGG
ncbi:serine/threonine-protein kinase [Kitasatospora griseola]|uniref:serine/threonine-protein kinase n=1 Tax=Kitasatospora griseola TaxID=2064 RepID=UPI00382A2AE6